MTERFQQYITSRAKVSGEELETILACGVTKKLRKHQYLLQEGDVWRYNAFVCSGCVRVYSVDNTGVEHIMRFAIEDWWAGDRESYTTGQPSKFNIDALEDSVLILWTKADFEKLLTDIPALKKFSDDLIAKSHNTSVNRVHAALTSNAEERYKEFIKKYPDIASRVPLHMIASYLGITPVTLSRIRSQAAKK
jgi:CRP-like cAMP-binding protein